ncbi:LSU ribosomal protein L10p (P0) [Olavius algarvensis spirochete endosymbiont]|uniref:50S ribosomal protein L10 n=1 Tax=Olavius algarvensis spirochete endosymbiont TaxID=260710 RepID=UPI000F1CE521|nr:50S ribosomal protein L10 [Olavius algarvensis spirochete endosymbiont]VDB00914.1 LSU ribosomal protein L10p (P0) [Olavius algarvensis spirochete endosymbiont]
MAKTERKVQQDKIDAVAALKSSFEGVRSFLFSDYRGLSVEQISILRNTLRQTGAEFHVVKNNYAKIAFSQLKHDNVDPYFIGPTAIAYCTDEAGPVAKAMLNLARDMPITLKGGLLNGEIFDADAIEVFSKLPGRLELLQKLMSLMMAPAQYIVFILNGVATKLVRTLDAVRVKKSEAD